MKKIIIAASLALFATSAFAQNATVQTKTKPKVKQGTSVNHDARVSSGTTSNHGAQVSATARTAPAGTNTTNTTTSTNKGSVVSATARSNNGGSYKATKSNRTYHKSTKVSVKK